METYDFRNTQNIGEIPAMLDSMSSKEIRAVGDAIVEIKRQSQQEEIDKCSQWITDALVPIIKDFAELTCSILTIDKEGTLIIITLSNTHSLDITGVCRGMHIALNAASQISIQLDGKDITLTLTYDCNQFVD